MQYHNTTSNEVKHLNRFGATITPEGVYFQVWAPHAQQVCVIGDFNSWQPMASPMIPDANGYWRTEVENAKAGDHYKYLITTQQGHQVQRNDPYAKAVTNSVGNSIIVDPSFDWEDAAEFKLPAHNDLVIYELHIGTFNKEKGQMVGDFTSAIKRLDYLQWLGVNAVEVMPPFEFAGDLSWGYNPSHPFAIEIAYGGPKAFKTFVKECHKRGIAVILDVVYNHFGPSDLDLWQFDGWSENNKGGIYFYNDWRSETPWGDTRPDYGRPEVQRYLIENALMWLSEYRCDGLRLDMTPYIRNVHANDNPHDDLPSGMQVLQSINAAVQHHFPHKLVIAEDLHSKDFVTAPINKGGLGFNAQWDAQFVHPMQSMLKIADDLHRDILAVEKALQYKYGSDAFNRVIYTESHDEVANGKARIVEEIAPNADGDNYYAEKRSLLGLAVTMTAPGIPMMFQGQAILEDKWFTDTDAVDWSKLKDNRGFATSVKDLIALRLNKAGRTAGLQAQHVQTLQADNTAKVIAYHRFHIVETEAKGSVVVIANFSNQEYLHYTTKFPACGDWLLVFNSAFEGYSKFNNGDDKAWHTMATTNAQNQCIADVHIPPYGVLIYVKA